jgi:hypothetical protein
MLLKKLKEVINKRVHPTFFGGEFRELCREEERWDSSGEWRLQNRQTTTGNVETGTVVEVEMEMEMNWELGIANCDLLFAIEYQMPYRAVIPKKYQILFGSLPLMRIRSEVSQSRRTQHNTTARTT